MTLPVLSPCSAARRSRSKSRVASWTERSARSARTGQEHPGQGDVLELAQVAEVVRSG